MPSRIGVTRFLVVLAAIVLTKALEMRTGWPDAVTLPVAALAGTALLDRVAYPPGLRLSGGEWVGAAVAALALGALIAWAV